MIYDLWMGVKDEHTIGNKKKKAEEECRRRIKRCVLQSAKLRAVYVDAAHAMYSKFRRHVLECVFAG